jgi:predicted GTPase
MASVYPLRDNEPWFLALDSFALHKNKGIKVRKNKSEAAKKKRQTKERLQQELRNAFKKLNVTLLIILGGYTSYV